MSSTTRESGAGGVPTRSRRSVMIVDSPPKSPADPKSPTGNTSKLSTSAAKYLKALSEEISVVPESPDEDHSHLEEFSSDMRAANLRTVSSVKYGDDVLSQISSPFASRAPSVAGFGFGKITSPLSPMSPVSAVSMGADSSEVQSPSSQFAGIGRPSQRVLTSTRSRRDIDAARSLMTRHKSSVGSVYYEKRQEEKVSMMDKIKTCRVRATRGGLMRETDLSTEEVLEEDILNHQYNANSNASHLKRLLMFEEEELKRSKRGAPNASPALRDETSSAGFSRTGGVALPLDENSLGSLPLLRSGGGGSALGMTARSNSSVGGAPTATTGGASVLTDLNIIYREGPVKSYAVTDVDDSASSPPRATSSLGRGSSSIGRVASLQSRSAMSGSYSAPSRLPALGQTTGALAMDARKLPKDGKPVSFDADALGDISDRLLKKSKSHRTPEPSRFNPAKVEARIARERELMPRSDYLERKLQRKANEEFAALQEQQEIYARVQQQIRGGRRRSTEAFMIPSGSRRESLRATDLNTSGNLFTSADSPFNRTLEVPDGPGQSPPIKAILSPADLSSIQLTGKEGVTSMSPLASPQLGVGFGDGRRGSSGGLNDLSGTFQALATSLKSKDAACRAVSVAPTAPTSPEAKATGGGDATEELDLYYFELQQLRNEARDAARSHANKSVVSSSVFHVSVTNADDSTEIQAPGKINTVDPHGRPVETDWLGNVVVSYSDDLKSLMGKLGDLEAQDETKFCGSAMTEQVEKEVTKRNKKVDVADTNETGTMRRRSTFDGENATNQNNRTFDRTNRQPMKKRYLTKWQPHDDTTFVSSTADYTKFVEAEVPRATVNNFERGPDLHRIRQEQEPSILFDLASEAETFIPEQDLHLYQVFCAHRRMTIILRPVSESVPNLYAGNAFIDKKYCDADGVPIPNPKATMDDIRKATSYVRRVKGKSISVSLKSSIYPPIDGLIPVNPALGKAYLNLQKRLRELEDMFLSAQGSRLVSNKLKAQIAQARGQTAAFTRDIEGSLERSNKQCKELWKQYESEVMFSVDKAGVSRKYIDQFTEAQFLGNTTAKWRGLPVYYKETIDKSKGDDNKENEEKDRGPKVERDDNDAPIFYILRSDGKFYKFNPEPHVMDTQDYPEVETHELFPVQVITHRSFFISPMTHRIEEAEDDAYLIGPDFDGLAYSQHLEAEGPWSSKKHIARAEMHTKPKLMPGMGLVHEEDIEHVKEMRLLTEWKQNHGYESGNTIKSQPIDPGVYVTITPHCVRILSSFTEIIGYYRHAWVDSIPLELNPNWKVCIDEVDGLPVPYGEELAIPIVDDCGMAKFMMDIEDAEKSMGITRESIEGAFRTLEDRVEELRSNGIRQTHKVVVSSRSELVNEFCLVKDKKRLAESFFAVRRWQLFPPWYRQTELAIIPDEEFENYRAQRVNELMAEYEHLEKLFLEMYPDKKSLVSQNPGSEFQKLLAGFLRPEGRRTIDEVGGSMAMSMLGGTSHGGTFNHSSHSNSASASHAASFQSHVHDSEDSRRRSSASVDVGLAEEHLAESVTQSMQSTPQALSLQSAEVSATTLPHP